MLAKDAVSTTDVYWQDPCIPNDCTSLEERHWAVGDNTWQKHRDVRASAIETRHYDASQTPHAWQSSESEVSSYGDFCGYPDDPGARGTHRWRHVHGGIYHCGANSAACTGAALPDLPSNRRGTNCSGRIRRRRRAHRTSGDAYQQCPRGALDRRQFCHLPRWKFLLVC